MKLNEEKFKPLVAPSCRRKGGEGDVGDLDDLEPDSGDITDGVTFTTESSDQDFVVLLDTDLLEDDTLGVRGSSEGIGLPPGAKMGLLVVLIGPHLVTPVVDVFTSGLDT